MCWLGMKPCVMGRGDKCLAQICMLLCGYFFPQHIGSCLKSADEGDEAWLLAFFIGLGL